MGLSGRKSEEVPHYSKQIDEWEQASLYSPITSTVYKYYGSAFFHSDYFSMHVSYTGSMVTKIQADQGSDCHHMHQGAIGTRVVIYCQHILLNAHRQ